MEKRSVVAATVALLLFAGVVFRQKMHQQGMIHNPRI